MYKKWFTGFLLLALLYSLMGCRGHLRQDIMIMGEVHEYSDRSVTLSLSSTLLEESMIRVILKEIGSDKIAWEGITAVIDGGFIKYEFKRPKINQQYKLEVLFEPNRQKSSIQNVYGKLGEHIRDDSPGYRSYTYGKKTINGIVMYGVINSFDQETEGKVQHQSWYLESDFTNLESMLE